MFKSPLAVTCKLDVVFLELHWLQKELFERNNALFDCGAKEAVVGTSASFFSFFFLDTHDLRMAPSDTHPCKVRTSTHRKSDVHFNQDSH